MLIHEANPSYSLSTSLWQDDMGSILSKWNAHMQKGREAFWYPSIFDKRYEIFLGQNRSGKPNLSSN